MICRKCGRTLPDTCKFCNYCGEKTEMSYDEYMGRSGGPTPYPSPVPAAPYGNAATGAKNPLNKKMLIIIGAAAGGLILIIILICVLLFSGSGESSPEKAAKAYYAAIIDENEDDLLKLIPEDAKDYLDRKKKIDEKDLRKKAKSVIKSERNYYVYKDIGKYTRWSNSKLVVEDVDSLERSAIKSMEKALGIDIDDAASVDVYADVYISSLFYTSLGTVYVYEYNGRWYVWDVVEGLV